MITECEFGNKLKTYVNPSPISKHKFVKLITLFMNGIV